MECCSSLYNTELQTKLTLLWSCLVSQYEEHNACCIRLLRGLTCIAQAPSGDSHESQRYRNSWLVHEFGVLAPSSQWTQQHIGFEQSKVKMSERFSWYTLLNHLTCDKVSLAAISQLGCDMSAQLSLVNSHVYYLSCNMSAWLHSIAQMKSYQLCCIHLLNGRPTSWLQSINSSCNL